MPISIIETPEPLTEASFDKAPKLIASVALDDLVHDLERYCRREVSGRSFLISGHRGAGKTMLVSHALQQAIASAATDASMLRPLFIPLHGPNLLPPIKPPGKDGTNDQEDSEMQTALKQITLGLHRAVAREVVRCYKARVVESYQDIPLRFQPRFANAFNEHSEMAAQLEVELYECPSPSRLREYWARAGFLKSGILRRLNRYPTRPISGQVNFNPDFSNFGWNELVAISGICEAYRRISGTFTQEEKRTDADDLKSERTVGVATPGKDLYGPLFSLLAGGLVGVGLTAAKADPFVATISGILSAIASAGVMKYSSTRTRARSLSRQYTFLYDLSVATLDRVLPLLVERLREAGLAPVFVVDELDKVDDLSDRMVGMVHHLKKFVAESAFFVFITDRSYFESFRRRVATEPFPVEHTYFSAQLYIVFRPSAFHKYIGEIIQEPPSTTSSTTSSAARSPDSADYPLLPLILLHKSRMHPIDLRREIANLRDDRGNVSLRPGQVRTSRSFQFDVRMQLAIEYVLESNEDFVNLLDDDPQFRRIAYDAMYYLTREWSERPNQPLWLGDALSDRLRTYLVNRMGKDRPSSRSAPQPKKGSHEPHDLPDLERVAESDCKFLAARVLDLANLLANDSDFRSRLRDWNKRLQAKKGPRASQATPPRIPQPVLDALAAMPFDLLRATKTANEFEWNFYPSGMPRTDDAREQVKRVSDHSDWSESAAFIRRFGRALDVISQ